MLLIIGVTKRLLLLLLQKERGIIVVSIHVHIGLTILVLILYHLSLDSMHVLLGHLNVDHPAYLRGHRVDNLDFVGHLNAELAPVDVHLLLLNFFFRHDIKLIR
jgi:hypothetical protein